jgi:hypothetical protein
MPTYGKNLQKLCLTLLGTNPSTVQYSTVYMYVYSTEVTTSVPECNVNGIWDSLRGDGEGAETILIGQTVPPPLLEWHSKRLKLSPLYIGQFHRAAIIQGVLLYTMNPSKTARKSIGGWDNTTLIVYETGHMLVLFIDIFVELP